MLWHKLRSAPRAKQATTLLVKITLHVQCAPKDRFVRRLQLNLCRAAPARTPLGMVTLRAPFALLALCVMQTPVPPLPVPLDITRLLAASRARYALLLITAQPPANFWRARPARTITTPAEIRAPRAKQAQCAKAVPKNQNLASVGTTA